MTDGAVEVVELKEVKREVSLREPVSRIDVDRSVNGQAAPMPVKGAGGVLPLTIMLNGTSVGEIDGRRQRLGRVSRIEFP